MSWILKMPEMTCKISLKAYYSYTMTWDHCLGSLLHWAPQDPWEHCGWELWFQQLECSKSCTLNLCALFKTILQFLNKAAEWQLCCVLIFLNLVFKSVLFVFWIESGKCWDELMHVFGLCFVYAVLFCVKDMCVHLFQSRTADIRHVILHKDCLHMFTFALGQYAAMKNVCLGEEDMCC